MHTTKLVSVLVGLTLLAGLVAVPVVAAPQMQGGNLLQDPHFDLAAQGNWKWQQWSYQVEIMQEDHKKDPDLSKSFYAPGFLGSEPKWDHESGGTSGAAGDISGQAFKKFRAGFYQTVQVAKGTRVRFSIWANELCQDGGGCSVFLKAGIDPTGGTDWSSGNIKWTGVELSNSTYVQLVPEEVTVGDSGAVTVFTWGEPRDPVPHSSAFFDDAVLSVTGTSTAPAAGTPAAQQPGQPAATAQPGACAQLGWVSDVTIPDNTEIAPGAAFVKTWRVKNNGSCAFSGTLNFIGAGNQMGGQSPTALPTIEAGQQADVSVNLTAPTQPGDYRGTWQPRTNDGAAMQNLLVLIKVSATAATPIPPATATPQIEPTPTVPPTPATGQICIQAYNDPNGDGQQSADETLLPGAVFTLSDANGPKDSYTTDSVSEPHCFTDLALGNYHLTIKPPASYASTTVDAMDISLSAGIAPDIRYGAKHSGPAPVATSKSSTPSASAIAGGSSGSAGRTILLVVGILVLIVLIGAGGFVLLSRRRY